MCEYDNVWIGRRERHRDRGPGREHRDRGAAAQSAAFLAAGGPSAPGCRPSATASAWGANAASSFWNTSTASASPAATLAPALPPVSPLLPLAQADLGDNAAVMRDPRPLVNRLEIARRVWAAAGLQVPDGDVTELVDPGFVARAAQQASLAATGSPVNDTFSISANIDLSSVSTEDAATLAVLPCRRFSFLPDSTELTLESRRILDECVVPTMSQSVGLLLEVKGSSAWPANDPPYTEDEILEFAQARAQSVVDYLVSQGIDEARFIVTATLPPEDHWESDDPAIQAEDRFVEMTLITTGR